MRRSPRTTRARRAPEPPRVMVEVVPVEEAGRDPLRTAYRLLARKLVAEQGDGQCALRSTSE
ncbi:MAG: hypothetical protein AB1446_06495 [Bacillota bacterium]